MTTPPVPVRRGRRRSARRLPRPGKARRRGGGYGNDLALKAVLRDIAAGGADLAVCGGDLVGYGVHPNEVIHLLRERKMPVIMGNYDDGVGFDRPECGCAYRDPAMARAIEATELPCEFAAALREARG